VTSPLDPYYVVSFLSGWYSTPRIILEASGPTLPCLRQWGDILVWEGGGPSRVLFYYSFMGSRGIPPGYS
jgi:hypothetical protein